MEIPIFLTAIRLLVPLLILRFPLFGILLSSLVDMYDWQFYPFRSEKDLIIYQNWDKALDFYYQLLIFYIVLRFKDKFAKMGSIFFFSYRTLGLLVFSITNGRYFLFFFPNFFENFVILYLSYVFLTKNKILFRSKKIIALVLSVVLLPKLFHEYFQHFLLHHPWEIYDVGAFVGATGIIYDYVNYLSWGILLYIIPMGTLLFVLPGMNKKT